MSDSNSSGRSIDDSFWINSPSPEAEEEKDDEGKEWAFEIVGEEVDANGQIRYEVDWDGWERADGTTQTWQPMEDNLTNEWRRTQKRRRDAILKDSIDIELGPFSGVDLHNDSTRLRAQAYEEKLALRRRYSPKLEEQMAKLLAEKLGSGTDLDNSPSPTSAGPATPVGRGLRLSTVRQRRHSFVTVQSQGAARGQDDARIPRMPSSSLWSSKLAEIASAKSSGSSSTSRTFLWTPVTSSQPSRSIDTTVSPFRDSQDSASRKRKVSGKMAQQNRSAQELAAESDDSADLNYREHRSVKRLRIVSPQGSEELERKENQENRVDSEVVEFENNEQSETESDESENSRFLDSQSEYAGSLDTETKDAVNSEYDEQSTTDSVEGENGRIFDSESQYVEGSYAGIEDAAELESDKKSTMNSAEPERRDGRFLYSESEHVEDSGADTDGSAVESRKRTRKQMYNRLTAFLAPVKELPDKEGGGTAYARSSQGKKLNMKYGEGNSCDRCARDGIVCLSWDRGNVCLRCKQQKRKCGLLTQSGPLPRATHTLNPPPDKSLSAKSKIKVSGALQVPIHKHRPQLSEQQIALSTQATNFPVGGIEQLTKSVQEYGEYVKQLVELKKMDLDIQWMNMRAESEKAPKVVVPGVLDKAASFKIQRNMDYGQYEVGLERGDLHQADGVGESEKVTKSGEHAVVTFGDLVDTSEESTTGQTKIAGEKLALEWRGKAEKRVRQRAREEQNRIKKGAGKEVEGEEDESE